MSPISNNRLRRKRTGRVLAGTVAASLAIGGVALVGGQGAGAATAPQAQSAGNFLDAKIGTSTIDSIAKLQFARAEAPGSNGVQNPLNVTVLSAIHLPLTGALQLPQLLGINLGAVNQVAQAKLDGYSYGAAGAVNNSGGVSIGGNNNAFPANATINLTASGLAGNSPIPIPGGTGSADALGGVKASIGAVSSLAQTPAGYGKAGTASYDIADVSLELGSPLLGGILGTVTGVVGQVVTALTGALPGGTSLPGGCSLTQSTSLTAPITLEGGAVVLDPANAKITVSLAKLLTQLGLDLNNLAPNTDLIDLLLNYLSSPNGLAKAVQGALDGLVNPLIAQYDACKAALQAIPVLGPIIVGLITTLTNGKTTLENTISGIVSKLGMSVGGKSPLAPLGTVLKKLLDIGVNVQPLVHSGNFTTQLDNLPKQGMVPPAVPYGTLVRAIELHIVGDPLLTIALANSAAGPSAAAAVSPSSSASAVSGSRLPTGVPAGQGVQGGSPVTPIVLLVVGLMLAAGGAVAFRVRGTRAL